MEDRFVFVRRFDDGSVVYVLVDGDTSFATITASEAVHYGMTGTIVEAHYMCKHCRKSFPRWSMFGVNDDAMTGVCYNDM